MARLRVILAAWFVLLAFGAASQAQAQAPGRRVALVIGNSGYSAVPRLPNPTRDASLMERTLQRVGFQTISLHNDLGRSAFEAALREFTRQADGAEVALVYYAGHGMEANGRNWLIPVDARLADERDLNFEAVDLERVLAAVDGARGLRLVLLDACRDNPFSRSMRRLSTTRNLVTRGLAEIEVTGTLVVYAARAGSTADDGAGGNSPFATALARRLPQPGVDISLVMRQVRDDVLAATERRQEPFQYGSLPGVELYLAPQQGAGSMPPPIIAPPVAAPPSEELPAARPRVTPASGWATRPRRNGETFRDCDVCPEMTAIAGGSFLMGSPDNEAGHEREEGPQRRVTIQRFAVGAHEITFAQWDACVEDGGCRGYAPNDHGWGRGSLPVTNVSWLDAQAYVDWLNDRLGGARRYRLLSEAEWEYAARAGTTTAYAWGASASRERANYGAEAGGRAVEGRDRWAFTAPVGSFPANAFGLFDMQGNVWEWVEDCWSDTYAGAPSSGAARSDEMCAGFRVKRGGSWNSSSETLRSAARRWDSANESFVDVGFRVARAL
ncbi:MAG: SUMF1/EgtB/PvdO family nonheme iron enzyme [Hyphomonadaceae bacterium]|nr:SUMF1/EgtB/PvdO family nonheme iron enzyme [Hyphomonadaceae bacterium]